MNKTILQSKMMGKGKSAYDHVLDELKIMKTIEHPNIIFLYEIIDDPQKDNIFLVTEYHSRGSLGDMLLQQTNKNGINHVKARLYLIDIVRALHYCHKTINVIHRDIKPDNIVINHNEEAVLIDFGVSQVCEEGDTLNGVTGTQMFYAPEMFPSGQSKQLIHGEATDIWALGVTFFWIITGKYPFGDVQNCMALKEAILNQKIDLNLIKNSNARECIS